MAKTTKRKGLRGGTLRIEAARINVKNSRVLGREPDARIIAIAQQPMSANDTYTIEKGRLAG